MKPVLTPEQAGAWDAAAQARGVGVEELMERAGWAVARAALDLLGGAYGRRVVVVCGKGNNAGDGLVAARHLARGGVRVAVALLEGTEALRGPAASNLARLRGETDVRQVGPGELARELARAHLAVDAIVGTGFRGRLEGALEAGVAALAAAGVPVIAIDIPSGVDGSTGEVVGPAVRADLTVTFGAPKVGAVVFPGAELTGDLRVVDIGLPDDAVEATLGLVEPADVAAVLPERAADAHKRASGTVLVVAGSRSMTGAVRLVARAAARIGAGYVIVAVPSSILPVVQAELTEAVFQPLPETDEGTVSPAALDLLLARAGDADAVAVGPGLTTHAGTVALVRDLVRESPAPVVLDADGLNAFAGDGGRLADRKADAILTPHAGELRRLLDHPDDPVAAARALARLADAVALVKGTRTVIAEAGGQGRINPTGTPTLATAGTGDVLTGTIGGLLARHVDPFAAAWAGAYLHGLAGVRVGATEGEGAVAGDVAEALPEAVALVRRQA
jgi:NAD(P)H-hydrate epimerase